MEALINEPKNRDLLKFPYLVANDMIKTVWLVTGPYQSGERNSANRVNAVVVFNMDGERNIGALDAIDPNNPDYHILQQGFEVILRQS